MSDDETLKQEHRRGLLFKPAAYLFQHGSKAIGTELTMYYSPGIFKNRRKQIFQVL